MIIISHSKLLCFSYQHTSSHWKNAIKFHSAQHIMKYTATKKKLTRINVTCRTLYYLPAIQFNLSKVLLLGFIMVTYHGNYHFWVFFDHLYEDLIQVAGKQEKCVLHVTFVVLKFCLLLLCSFQRDQITLFLNPHSLDYNSISTTRFE